MKKKYKILFFLLLTFFSFRTSAQVAGFTANPPFGCGSAIVQFNNTSTGFTSCSWNFGNGNNSTDVNPSATYNSPGTYTVTLTVSNGTTTSTISHTVTVYTNPSASFNITPDSACVGSTISFNSTSTPGTGGSITHFLWTYGDGSLDSITGSSPTHSYGFANSFTVNLIVTDQHGCNSTIAHNVVTLNGPTADFIATPLSSCNAPVTITFTNTTSGSPTGYVWNFGDPASGANNTSTASGTVTHTFNTTGTFNVQLTATSPGCNSIHLVPISVLQTAAAFTMNDTAVCIGGTVSFVNHTLPAVATYTWNFGDPSSGGNNTSTLPNPNHTFLSTGVHVVTLTSTANGCPSTITHNVLVRNSPVPVIVATPSVGCLIPFVVSFNVSTPNIASWQWNFNDPASAANNTSTLALPSHSYNSFGIYHPSVTVTDSFGCIGTAFFNTVTTQPPVADFFPSLPDSGCIPLTVQFINNSASIDPITQYFWNFGDPASGANDTSSLPNPLHIYNNIGIFDVTLIIHTQGGCVDTLVRPRWVSAGVQPTNVDFTWTPDTVCFGQSVTFTSLTPPPVTGWKWDFGDGGMSSGSPTASHQYSNDTATIVPYTVTLIAYYNGCPDTMIHQHIITVLLPVPDFIPAHNCATPYTITFQNTSRGATAQYWNFGDSSPLDTSKNPVHTFPGRGTFVVTLTDTNVTTGCSYFKSLSVVITDPKAEFSASDTGGCFHHTINFNSDSSKDVNPAPPDYLWNFGDPLSANNISTLANPSHLYDHPGIYTVQLTIYDIYGCPNDSSIQVHIIGPTAAFTATPRFGCSPLNVELIDTSHVEGGTDVTRIWTFATATSPVTILNDSVIHTYSVPNAAGYTVKLKVTDSNGCTDSITKPFYIVVTNPTPSLLFGDTIACPNALIHDTVTSGNNVALPVKYEIDYGDLSSHDSITSGNTTAYFSHTYSANGVYHVTIRVTDANGCDSVVTRNLTILKPTADFDVTSNYICVTQPPFSVQITLVNANYTDHSTGLTSTGNHWSWDFDNSSQSIFQNPTGITYTLAGNYSPQLIVTNGAGCSDTLKRINLVNVPGPAGIYSFAPLTGCHPLTVNFAGATSGGGIFYSWDFGDGTVLKNVPDTIVSHMYVHDGIYHPYFFIGYVQPNGDTCRSVGKNLTNDSVVVHTYITVDIDSSFIILNEGQQTTVHATVFDTTAFGGPPFSFSWVPAADIAANGPTAVITGNDPADSVYYYCTVTNAEGCQATDSLRLMIIACDSKSIIPNVFTPNGDNLNDTYHIDNLCQGAFHFTIYNRWGTIIYESTDPDFHWNGKTTGGSDASDGTYYYICKTRKSELHGFIQLIRK